MPTVLATTTDLVYWNGLPQFVWEAIANIVITLGAGLIIAFFTSTFLKKREERIRVAGVILEKRINCEQEILTYIEKTNFKYELPKNKHAAMLETVSIYGIKLPYGTALQYSEVFTDPVKFEKYVLGLEELISKNRLWVDKDVRSHLIFIQAYYANIRIIPVMLRRFPLPEKNKLTDEQYQMLHKNILWQYGIILDAEINGFVSELEELIVASVYKLDLRRPKKSITRNLMQNQDIKNITKRIEKHTILGQKRDYFYSAIWQQINLVAGVDMNSMGKKEYMEMAMQAYEEEIYNMLHDIDD